MGFTNMTLNDKMLSTEEHEPFTIQNALHAFGMSFQESEPKCDVTQRNRTITS